MNKIVFVGNPKFASDLLDSLSKWEIEIPLVVTQKDKKRSRGKVQASPVKETALNRGLEVHCTDDINSDDTLRAIDAAEPDFIVVVAFGQMLNKDILKKYEDRVLNVHASILPKYRGASPINYSLLNGDEYTGTTIMIIDEGMDTGDILKICKLKINDSHNYENLSHELSSIGADCLAEAILDFENLYKNRRSQNVSEASYTGFIEKSMGEIIFEEEAKKIKNKWRSFYNWPKLYTNYNGQNLKVHDFYVIDKFSDSEPGKIIKVDKNGIYVNCKDSCLVLTDIQFPGKKRMKVSDYIKGNEIECIKLG
ncbi:MAG: methionyl-tRNA formyltransferase [Tissierellia bacterium]|nr:methionyl-tRNA formyltransferase [Tissierellia bacterium]